MSNLQLSVNRGSGFYSLELIPKWVYDVDLFDTGVVLRFNRGEEDRTKGIPLTFNMHEEIDGDIKRGDGYFQIGKGLSLEFPTNVLMVLDASDKVLRPERTLISLEAASVGCYPLHLNRATSVVLEDFTDRQRTETLLRESEDRFRTILESAAIGISVNTSEGVPIVSNPAMQRMLGYTGDELGTMDYLQFTHPDDRESETLLMADLIAGRIDKYQVEKRYICKSGRMMWGRLTVSLLDQGGGEPLQFVAMVEDITDRKRAESDSRQREAELKVIAESPSRCDRPPLSARWSRAWWSEPLPHSRRAPAGCCSSRTTGSSSSPAGDSLCAAGTVEIPEDDSLAWQVIRSGQMVCRPDGVNGAGSPAADPLCRARPRCIPGGTRASPQFRRNDGPRIPGLRPGERAAGQRPQTTGPGGGHRIQRYPTRKAAADTRATGLRSHAPLEDPLRGERGRGPVL